jgi:hypothetical protein
MSPYSVVGVYQCFGGTCCLHLLGSKAILKMEIACTPETLINTYKTA